MRQVSRDQLIQSLSYHMHRTRPGIRKMLEHWNEDVRRDGARIIATDLVDNALRRFEILTDTPLPPFEIDHSGM